MTQTVVLLVVGLIVALLAGCGTVPRDQKVAVERKPSRAQLCRFERGNCQTILIVDELPHGGVDAR